jgi:3-deoxy-D-manno-octulosonic-acid transferase
VRRFLDHWRPDVALFTESEIWPNLLLETTSRGVPTVLFNARMSQRSFKRWSRRKNASAAVFGRFTTVLAQNESLARRFRDLGTRNVIAVGNIKIDAPPPPVDTDRLAELQTALSGRPIFLAASTHDGEEILVAEAHRTMIRDCERLCTIIVPRHPERGAAIAAKLVERGFSTILRSTGALPGPDTSFYIADTIGELGTFYALAPVSFIGGSLIAHGGQNPIEAIGHGSAVLTGPHWHNFNDIYTTLLRLKGASEVHSSAELAARATMLLKNQAMIETFQAGAKTAMLLLGGALDKTVDVLLPLIDEAKGSNGAA